MARRYEDPLYVPVITAYDLVEHAEIQSLLESEGIRTFKNPGDTTGLMGPTDHFEILVHGDDEEDAIRILEKEGFFAEPEEVPPDPPEVVEKKERSKAQDLFLGAMLFILLAVLFGVLPRL